jgi:hypothetical protein
VRCLFGFSSCAKSVVHKLFHWSHPSLTFHVSLCSQFIHLFTEFHQIFHPHRRFIAKERMESKPTVICIAPDPPDHAFYNKTRVRHLKEILQDVTRADEHKTIRVIIELYESGKISAAHRQTLYVQDGQVFEEKPPRRVGFPIWEEVSPPLSFLNLN